MYLRLITLKTMSCMCVGTYENHPDSTQTNKENTERYNVVGRYL